MRKNIQEKKLKNVRFLQSETIQKYQKMHILGAKVQNFSGGGPLDPPPPHWQASPAFSPAGKNSCGEPWDNYHAKNHATMQLPCKILKLIPKTIGNRKRDCA